MLHRDSGIPPPPRGYLARPRLDAHWRSWCDRRLVLVTAGAGFGKTSFLSGNVRRDPRPCLWFSLEDVDREPSMFYARLSGSDPAQHGRVRGRALGWLLDALRSGIPVVVIDDVQVVSECPEIIASLEELVRNLPPGCTAVLSSREPVPMRIARLRAEGGVASLASSDFLFTEDEVARLLRFRFPGTRLLPALAKRIAGETEGWAAGIEILLQACNGASPFAIDEALEIKAGAREGWFAYFVEEVLSRLDPHVRDFARRASLLPYLDPDLCDRTLGVSDSRHLLEELCRRNLFTFRESSGEVFRFHHLFRAALRGQLARDLDPASLRSLQLGVARGLAQAARWAEAAAIYAEAGNQEDAVESMERCGSQLLAAGQYRALEQALQRIPESRRADRASIQMLQGRLLDVQGRWEEATAYLQRALRLARSNAVRDELVSLLVMTLVRKGQRDRALALCRRSLVRNAASQPRVRATLSCLEGLLAAERGRLDDSERHLLASVALSRRIGDPGGEGRALFVLAANVLVWRGEFEAAKNAARQSLLVHQRAGDQRGACHSIAVLSFLALGERDVRTAKDLAGRSLAQAEEIGCRLIEGLSRCLLGRCALLDGNLEAAQEEFAAAGRIERDMHEPFFAIYLRTGLAQLALAEGRGPRARSLAAAAMRFARLGGDRVEEGHIAVLFGLIEERTRPDCAERWWRKAEAAFRKMGADYEIHRLQLLRLDLGRMPHAERRRTLESLVAGVAAKGHEFLLLDIAPERAARVLPEALRLDVEPGFVASILQRLGTRSVPGLAALADEGPDPVRERAVGLLATIGGTESRSVLRRVAGSTSRAGRAALRAAREMDRSPEEPLRIAALGSFSIGLGDLDITRSVARSAQSLRLLQYLVVRRFAWVAREEILEAFWSGVDPCKADNRLRQCVHVLRRQIWIAGEAARHSRYVAFMNGSYRLDPGAGYQYDVERFERDLEDGARLQEAGKVAAETKLRSALELYRGAFLEESPYEDFAAVERERLRERFIECLSRLLDLLSVRLRWEECVPLALRGIAEDSFNEMFHWHLVHSHIRLRHRQKAVECYQRYEELMARDLDLAPSPKMRALALQAAAYRR